MPFWNKNLSQPSSVPRSTSKLPHHTELEAAERLLFLARRRVLGAAMLLVVSCAFLPWILDSAPRPWRDDVILRMPRNNQPYQGNASAAFGAGNKNINNNDVVLAEPITPVPTDSRVVLPTTPNLSLSNININANLNVNGSNTIDATDAIDANNPTLTTSADTTVATIAAIAAAPLALRHKINDRNKNKDKNKDKPKVVKETLKLTKLNTPTKASKTQVVAKSKSDKSDKSTQSNKPNKVHQGNQSNQGDFVKEKVKVKVKVKVKHAHG